MQNSGNMHYFQMFAIRLQIFLVCCSTQMVSLISSIKKFPVTVNDLAVSSEKITYDLLKLTWQHSINTATRRQLDHEWKFWSSLYCSIPVFGLWLYLGRHEKCSLLLVLSGVKAIYFMQNEFEKRQTRNVWKHGISLIKYHLSLPTEEKETKQEISYLF